jgi:hypothetical protein
MYSHLSITVMVYLKSVLKPLVLLANIGTVCVYRSSQPTRSRQPISESNALFMLGIGFVTESSPDTQSGRFRGNHDYQENGNTKKTKGDTHGFRAKCFKTFGGVD